MRSLTSLAFLALWMSSTAVFGGVEWSGDLDHAIIRAQSEKKPLLVHMRGSCSRCNRALDELLAEAEKHEPILHAYGSFVLCRLDPGPDLSRLQAGDEQLRGPSVALLSPTGMYLTLAHGKDLNEYAAFLNRARNQSARIAQIDELRAAGKWLDAEMVAGRVVLSLGDFKGAQSLFDHTLAACITNDDEERGELAAIEGDYAVFLGDPRWEKRRSITAHLDSLARGSRFPGNVAAAHLRLGMMQAGPSGSVRLGMVRAVPPDFASAMAHFRAAFANAQPHSEAWVVAGQWLAAHGELVPKNEASTRATVRIIKPERATLTGHVELAAECAPEVARVAWFQDGVAVASASTLPFRARLDLGAVPRVHSIQARAFDVTGHAVGVSEIVINDRLDSFRVSIVAPVVTVISGMVLIEADAQAPAGSKIESVVLLWNEQTIARLVAPPYRATFEIPQEFGFIRAVATLDDGRTAEETKPVNERAYSMPVNVHDIVFPVTVTNRRGPIGGLRSSDFVVKDEGVRVAVTSQPDEGSTIGIALDSSTSMSRSLLEVMEMSSEMIEAAVTPTDKAFLMAFDVQPYMLEMASSDVQRLRTAAFDLAPVGSTSLYDAVAFGLQQFTGLPGRRALVLITDGIDVFSDQSGESCARMAREIGVPVYIVVTNGRRGMSTPNERKLQTIAGGTGGGIFFAPNRNEQRQIFRRIREEVRGQYLLTFTAPPAKPGSWRAIKVEAPTVRGSVRTIAGYYAR